MDNLIKRLEKCGVTTESRQAAKDAINEIERLTAERDAAFKSYLSTFDLMTKCVIERDMLVEALEEISETNASKHGTIGMMLTRCTTIAREALAKVKK